MKLSNTKTLQIYILCQFLDMSGMNCEIYIPDSSNLPTAIIAKKLANS